MEALFYISCAAAAVCFVSAAFLFFYLGSASAVRALSGRARMARSQTTQALTSPVTGTISPHAAKPLGPAEPAGERRTAPDRAQTDALERAAGGLGGAGADSLDAVLAGPEHTAVLSEGEMFVQYPAEIPESIRTQMNAPGRMRLRKKEESL